MPQLCMNPSLLLFHNNPVLARFARPMHAIVGYKEGGSTKDSERFVTMLFTYFKNIFISKHAISLSLLIKNQIFYINVAVKYNFPFATKTYRLTSQIIILI